MADASRIDLTPFVRAGDGIWWSQAAAEPTPLVHALLDQIGGIGAVRAYVGLSWDHRLTHELPEEIDLQSYGALGELRHTSAAGRLTIIPGNFSALPRMFVSGELPTDVGFVQVSPPDADGLYSLGIGPDYPGDAIAHTRVLIAEINRQMPVTVGSPRIPLARFAAMIETDRALPELPPARGTEVDQQIGRLVAELIEDGDTIQLGVGALPSEVMLNLRDRRDLGIHSGMISDGVADLVELGVVTGARKEVDRGLVVTAAAFGSSRLYERIPSLPARFSPASYTHAGTTLGALRSLVSINSAIEVDLSGQVNAELRGGVHIGAVGGQADFAHAAATSGRLSIIALRSRSGGRSTIAPSIATVTTTRSDVDAIVTEHGVAHLTGVPFAERAHRIIAIAAPEFREELERSIHQFELQENS